MSEIARSPVTFVWADGREVRGAVAIGRPALAPGGWWECHVALEGTEDALPAAGEDALQALTLGLTLAERLLRGFVARGGRLRDEEGNEWPLDAYFPAG